MTFDIRWMLNPDVYDHSVDQIELIETHISWVLLTGTYAYKIKKPVDFGFLDFSTLDKRRNYCELELKLNRRLAPAIYLDVVSISGSSGGVKISSAGEALEYAVKMHQFPQTAQLDHMLESGELKIEHMDAIALMVAEFHQTIDVADESTEYGNKSEVFRPVQENFIQIKQHIDTSDYENILNKLLRWSETQFSKLEAVFEQRKREGFIRECHGDMHLRNMVWLEEKGPTAFDCIEFNPELRWIDVISEVAFLVMDLQDRGRDRLANRFLNRYLEVTGDYAGLLLMRFYVCYRALVRAKVDALRLEQTGNESQGRADVIVEFESYLHLADAYTRVFHPKLILMRGVSASGKSTVSSALVDALGAVRIRSDVERKRLFDISVDQNVSTGVDAGIYSQEASEKTYARLLDLASQVILAGYCVIVDATFLDPDLFKPFLVLAHSRQTACVVVETTAPVDILRQRIVARQGDVSDARLEVLEHQLQNWRPLDKAEAGLLLRVDTSEDFQIDRLVCQVDCVGGAGLW